MLLQLDAEVVGEPVYTGRGRPSVAKSQLAISFKSLGWRQLAWLALKGPQPDRVFILATNDHSDTLTMAELLATYKSAAECRTGLSFSQEPGFLTSSLYLKKPERIEALLMVMTCSLMIYAALEHRIRQGLVEQNRSVADMKKTDPAADGPLDLLRFGGIHAYSGRS